MRLFILSDSPPEKDIQWSEQGMLASYKFVQKFWTLHKKILNKIKDNSTEKTNENLSIYTNRLIEKFTFNLEKFNLNVIIANLYETYNFLNKEYDHFKNSENLKDNYLKILILMLPVLPHLISECIFEVEKKREIQWPLADKKYLEDKYVNIVIQINGRKKTLIKMEKDIDDSSLLEKIKKDPKISDTLSKKNIDKYFIVKNKLINLLIK